MKQTLFIMMGLLLSAQTFGSSRVIKDNRLDDRGRTPSLGRGYSVTTNTLQSLCYKKVDVTIPSYDLKYTFQDIEEGWESNYSFEANTKASFSYWFLKANITAHAEGSGESKIFHHYIYAKIDLDSYYNSLNEATSRMSDSAKKLLLNKDVVGFFDACGPYYVRSIGRHSSFLALLRYSTKESTRSQSYEASLKAELKGFFRGGSVEVSGKVSNSNSHQKKKLNITIWAQGLGKDKLATLIPTDIESFKKTVQESILTMQDANTGIITSLEIVPWIENTDFQQYLVLEKEEDRLKYQEKKTIMANSEIISEIDRIDRGQMDNYYQMRNCYNNLKDQFPEKGKQQSESDNKYAYDYNLTLLKDISAPGNKTKEIPIIELLKQVELTKQEEIITRNDAFNVKAASCVNKIHEGGIAKISYKNHEECKDIRKESALPYLMLDHYCMPEFARIKKENEE